MTSPPQEVMALMLPDIPGVSDSADSEFLMVRGFLQDVAVKHNALVTATFEMSSNVRNHLRIPLDGALNSIGGLEMDMKTMMDVVNAHNKDSDSKMDRLVQSADSAQLARPSASRAPSWILRACERSWLKPPWSPRVPPQWLESLGSPAWPRPSSTSRT